MLRTLFLTAAGAFCGAVIFTAALLGGCGGKVTNRPDAAAAPATATAAVPATAEPNPNPAPESPPSSTVARDTTNSADEKDPTSLTEIGRDPSRLGRIETEAVVDATVFHAEHGTSRPGSVRLARGTWLLPANALPPPDDSSSAADGGK